MAEGSEAGTSGGPPSVRFGPFELDFRTAELRKNGRKIRLQEQPFQILRMLLESAGEPVSREDIRKRLWSEGTVVEFDHSINAAMKRLRDALSDSADSPRFIETIPRRGYRFIGEVDTPGYAPGSDPLLAPRDGPGAPGRHRYVLLVLSVITTLTVAGVIVTIEAIGHFHTRTGRSTPPLQPVVRLDMNLGSDAPDGSDHGADAILSPDGTRLVYISQSKLFVRQLDRATATELPGTDRAEAPFFSPDGRWVAFFATNRLKKISLQTGQVVDLAGVALGNGGSWGNDGTIVTAANVYLTKVSAQGGALTPLTELRSGEVAHRWPEVLPGCKAILFTAYRSMSGLETASIEAQSLIDGSRKTVLPGASFGRYVASGLLIYVAQGKLFAVPFDPDRLEAHGTPTPAIEEVAYSTSSGGAQFDISQNGTLVYRRSKGGRGLVTVQWLDGSGKTRPLLPVPGNYLSPTLSPDGGRLALTSGGDIWVYELGRGSMIRLSFGGGYANPLWTPDGHFIVFRSAREMLWTRADGSGQPRVLIENPGTGTQIPWSFTPDGRRLILVRNSAPGNAAIWTLPINTNSSEVRPGKAELFLQKPFAARGPAISPNGRWIAYASNESGRYRIYVEAFPEGGRKQPVSGDGANCVAWSRSGQELFFYGGDEDTRNRLMVVTLRESGDSLVASRPRLWSSREVATFPTTRGYDPAPDGNGVVTLLAADAPEEHQDRLVFLLNFFDELRRRMPAQ